MVTERVHHLLKRIAGKPPAEMCLERARLMTQSYRETEGEHTGRKGNR